jgi:hypothetical protein
MLGKISDSLLLPRLHKIPDSSRKFFYFFSFFLFDKIAKKGHFIGLFVDFSGDFLFLSSWINILGAEPTQLNYSTQYYLFSLISLLIFTPIFTLIYCYEGKR